MQETILVVYLIVAIALIGIILLQQGKGAEMGASFGAGAANTVFGAAGSGNVLTKTTTILAILFFAIALGISYLNSEPAVTVDTILDDGTTTEQTSQAVSVESELPTKDSGLDTEVAPMEKTAVEGEVSAETVPADTKATEKPVTDSEKQQEKKDDNH